MLICTIVCALLAAACAAISVMQFKERGFLFNNAYIWATVQERESMDKAPHYRQSGIAFALIAALFAVMALECALSTGWLWVVAGLLAGVVMVYAIVSSTKEQKK